MSRVHHSMSLAADEIEAHVDEMDAAGINSAVQKLNADISRINTRMKAALESAEASLALPAAPGGNGKAQMRKAGEPLSTEAADTNPHRHVMALQRRGIISNYGEVQRKTVVIIGLDGIGSAAAELLTRSGVGRLILFDAGIVSRADLCRVGYRAMHVGLGRTDALATSLAEIDPGVAVDTFRANVTATEGAQCLRSALSGEKSSPAADLVLMCAGDEPSQKQVNRLCLEMERPLIAARASADALSGTVELVLPGRSACLACSAYVAPPSNTVGEHAALPSTDAILAGMLVQTALKHLLEFQEAPAQGSLSVPEDKLASKVAKPHESCAELQCRKLQQKFVRKPSRSGALAAGVPRDASQQQDGTTPADVAERKQPHKVTSR